MRPRDKYIFWIGFILFLCLFLHSVSDILFPFVVSAVVAYFLNPAAEYLEKKGLSRGVSAILMIMLFFFSFAIAAILLAPIFYEQLISIINHLPQYIAKIESINFDLVKKLDGKFGKLNLVESIGSLSGEILSFFGTILRKILNSGVVIANILSLIFITPVVTFYMLRDWNNIINKINSWLPLDHAEDIRKQASLIDQTMSGYLRGQVSVCLLLGMFYAIALSFAGLEFSVFIGLSTGILSFIPYIGSMFGLIVSLTVAFFQFGNIYDIATIAIIFFSGQIIEGVFVAPKLLGDKVGLHPLWVMFGMLAGGALFGFTGILIAVPISAILGVLVRFSIEKYLISSFYTKNVKVKSRSKKQNATT